YIEHYFKLVKNIQQYKRSRIIWALNLVNVLSCMKTAHMIYLAFNRHMSHLERASHFDELYLLVPKEAYNAVVAICTVMTLYFNVCLLFRPNLALNVLLKFILISKTAEMHIGTSVNKNP